MQELLRQNQAWGRRRRRSGGVENTRRARTDSTPFISVRRYLLPFITTGHHSHIVPEWGSVVLAHVAAVTCSGTEEGGGGAGGGGSVGASGGGWEGDFSTGRHLESTGLCSAPAPRWSRSECKCRRRCRPGPHLQRRGEGVGGVRGQNVGFEIMWCAARCSGCHPALEVV